MPGAALPQRPIGPEFLWSFRGLGRGKGGAQGRIRTTDTRIFSPLLYQLSYLGTRGNALIEKFRRPVQAFERSHSSPFPRAPLPGASSVSMR